MTRAPLRPHLLLAALLAAPFSSAQALRTPYHGASDAVAQAEKAVLLEAWFSRSAGIQKAIEHAEVRVELQRGDAWIPLGQASSDGEGRAMLVFQAPAAHVRPSSSESTAARKAPWRWESAFRRNSRGGGLTMLGPIPPIQKGGTLDGRESHGAVREGPTGLPRR